MLLGMLAAGSATTPDEQAPSVAEVRAVLARHGAAVRGHAGGTFLADVSTAPASKKFRAAQRQQVANLDRLPITAWSYAVAAPSDAAGADAAASRRYGAPTVIYQLTLRYTLRGIDRIPARHDLWWTFVRRDGHVQIAGDDDLADDGGTSWRGPWDFGPIRVATGRDNVVIGYPQDVDLLPAISRLADAAVPAVTRVWGTGWARHVEVIVAGTSAQLTAALGSDPALGSDTAAQAESDGQDARSGRAYGQRLVIGAAAYARLRPIGRQIVFRHEITHLASADATTDASPSWLVEGFAEYVGNLDSGQPVRTAAAEEAAVVHRGQLPRGLPSAADFQSPATAARAYQQAWLACRLIAERRGAPGLVRFYRAVGASSEQPDAAVAVALRAVLGESTAQFVIQWRDYLRAQLA